MPRPKLAIYVFGSGLTSAYWNGAATYYRGIYKQLHRLGHRITFAEPNIYDRHRHRDLVKPPDYAHCPRYSNHKELDALIRKASQMDLIVKHSGVGENDEFLEAALPAAADSAPCGRRPALAFWDVDAPATLAVLEANPASSLRKLLPSYDFVFTYGGGPELIKRYCRLGARSCHVIYNGLDPETHFPHSSVADFRSDLSFLGHRLPDREARVRKFFLGAAEMTPKASFLLAGEGWHDLDLPANVRYAGYIGPNRHNELNSASRFVLNINRASMAITGFSPPTRIFEAAGAGAAVITDAWPGIEWFFEPNREILVAPDAARINFYLTNFGLEAVQALGRRMRDRALAEHTYERRAQKLDRILSGTSLLACNS